MGKYLYPWDNGVQMEEDNYPPFSFISEFTTKANQFNSTLKSFIADGGFGSIASVIRSEKEFEEVEKYIGRFTEDLDYIMFKSYELETMKTLHHKMDYVVELLNKKISGKMEFTPTRVERMFDSFLVTIGTWTIWRDQVKKIISGTITSTELSSVYKAWRVSGTLSECIKVAMNEAKASADEGVDYLSSLLRIEEIDLTEEDEGLVHYNRYDMSPSELLDKNDVVIYGNRKRMGLVMYNEEEDKVFAMSNFGEGDVIEVAKVRIFPKEDLFSRTIRSMAMELVPNRVYGYPMGNVMQYNHSPLGNAWLDFNDSRGVIYVRALKDIHQGEEVRLANDVASKSIYILIDTKKKIQ